MISILLGTRPEVIKLAPVIWELDRRKQDYLLVHSLQHYDYNMNKIFFEELGVREPDVFLEAGSDSDARQTSKIMIGFEDFIKSKKPGIVVVEGDTNTVLAGSIVAKKQGVLLAHVEAGARSFDKNMPEEVNRIACDHLSDVLFAPNGGCMKNLLNEKVPKENIVLSGNTQFETLQFALKKAIVPFETPAEFALVTMHRKENATPEKLSMLLKLLSSLEIPSIFLVHPRTRKVLLESGLDEKYAKEKKIILKDPVGFFGLVGLLKNASFVVTDSGGLQKEAAFLDKAVVIPRTSTEWPEILESGHASLVGLDGNSPGKARNFLSKFKPGKVKEIDRPSKVIVDKLVSLLKGGMT